MASISGRKKKESVAKFWLGIEEPALNHFTGEIEMLSQEDLMVMEMIKKAKKGNIAAFTAVMDRAYGKPKQQVQNESHHFHHIPAMQWANIPAEIPAAEAMPPLEEMSEEIEEAEIDDRA